MFDVIWLLKNLPYRNNYTPCWKFLIITTLAFAAWTKNVKSQIKSLSICNKIDQFLPVWYKTYFWRTNYLRRSPLLQTKYIKKLENKEDNQSIERLFFLSTFLLNFTTNFHPTSFSLSLSPHIVRTTRSTAGRIKWDVIPTSWQITI